jgi:plastocyanin
MGIRRMAPVLALALALGVAPASAAETVVTIEDFFFDAATVTVALGDSVRWVNDGDDTHTSSGRRDLSLWSRSIPSGGQVARTFKQAGTFPYLCTIHPSMTGTVKVPLRVTPETGTAATTFTVRVATDNAPNGFSYLIQRKKPGGTFKAWKTISTPTTTFKSSVVGTWSFRVKLRRNSNGGTSSASPVDTAVIS